MERLASSDGTFGAHYSLTMVAIHRLYTATIFHCICPRRAIWAENIDKEFDTFNVNYHFGQFLGCFSLKLTSCICSTFYNLITWLATSKYIYSKVTVDVLAPYLQNIHKNRVSLQIIIFAIEVTSSFVMYWSINNERILLHRQTLRGEIVEQCNKVIF